MLCAVQALASVQRLLDASSDPDNPSAEALEELFERMRRIAVIGLSRDPMKSARRVPSYLAAKGYDVIPVNPNAERILGRDAVPSLDDVADPVDLVIVFRPSHAAGRFVEQAARREEEPAIWLQQGITAPPEIRAARANGLLAVQDMCTYQVHRALDLG